MSEPTSHPEAARGALTPSRRLRHLLLLSMVWIVAASSPAVEAQGAGAGETVAESSTAATQDSEDAGTEADLRQRLRQISGTEQVEVRVEAGIATVSGSVLNSEKGQAIVELVSKSEGVLQVVNDLSLITDPRARLEPAMETALERLQLTLSYLPLFLVALLILAAFWLLSRWVARFDFLFDRVGVNSFARDLLRQAVRVAILLTGVLIALELLDATALVGAVLGAAGVVGLAVGFAFRDLIENYISSILLSLRQPFQPDDHVKIGEHAGKVVRLTSRATILMTLDGNHLRIPNSQVFKSVILNYSRNPRRRFSFGVGVGVGEDLQEAQRLGIEALASTAGVLEEPSALSLIEELGDSNVLIRFYGWVDQRSASFGKVKGAAIRRVKTALEAAGMDLPEPIYRVHLLEPGVQAAEASAEARTTALNAAAIADETVDVAPDTDLDRQIAEDRSGDEDEDLLSSEGRLE